jgi:pimeloyl-ACP methyl ester carboxylesterase
MEHYRRGELSFDVRDGGPADGEPVVLLHGFPQDGTSWRSVEPILHQDGLRTLAPDQRGYSPGARPRRRRDYRLSELADDVLALLDAAGLASAHVVGHDWGGTVGWLLAGRDAGRVRSLTVLSTPHPAALARACRSSLQLLKAWHILFFQLPLIPELVLPRALPAALLRTGLPVEFAAHDAARMRAPGAARAALNWYRAVPLALRTPLSSSRVATTYAWGRHDQFLGRTAAETTGNFVASAYRFVEVDGGHWLPETRPTEMAQLILDQVNAAG